MSEVTKLLPVTARFDGCFCDEACAHMCYSHPLCELTRNKSDCCNLGMPRLDTDDREKVNVHTAIYFGKIRTRWCCETFGMGDED